MFEHALAVVSELVKGLLRLGKDPLGGPAGSDTEPGGSLPLDACHPYGLRSRPRDPDKDAQGNPTNGCGLLIVERGGGDDGALPTQDPRITTLVDEGKGGAQLYGWTGSAVSYVLISGADGSITAKTGSGSILLDGTTAVGAAGGAPIARAPELQTWAAQVNVALTQIAALLNAPGAVTGAPGAVAVVPPLDSAVAATKGTVV